MDLSEPVLALADRMQSASGLAVTMLVDERRGSAGECRYPKLSITTSSYAGLGLYVPPDAGWRCGDYGFYLGRQAHPNIRHFWMIEADVRIAGDARRMFAAAEARPDLDLLVARLRPADGNWWWRAHAMAVDFAVWRCFFPVTRLSGEAIDLLHATRRRQSRRPSRRALWPNDEAFVASTVANSVLRYADLKVLGADLYDDTSYSYELIIDERSLGLDGAGNPKLLHPVLSGSAYQQKLARIAASHRPDPWSFRLRRAMARRANARLRW